MTNAAGNLQFSTGTTYRFRVDTSGNSHSSSSSRAPIFYDSNDTSYYINPNGTSNIDVLNNFSVVSGATECGIRYRVNSSGGDFSGRYSNYVALYNGISDKEIKIFDSSYISFNAYGLNSESWRAPIFYDSNNTAYYTNPASATRLNGYLSLGLPGAGSSTSGRWISLEGNADSSGEGSGRIFFAEHNSTTASMDNYGLSIAYRGGSTSIVGASGNTWTGLSAIGNGEWGFWGHDDSAVGALAMFGPRSGAYVTATGSFRAPVFYDSNDTGYYVDPASSTAMFSNGVIVAGTQGFQSRFYSNGVRNRIWSFNNADNFGISYFQGSAGVGGSDTIGIHPNGGATAAGATLQVVSGYTQSLGSMRAPIFYDSNNTGYYIDPASSSKLNGLTANGYTLDGGTDGYFNYTAMSWNGVSTYPTLYGAAADRWVMHLNPHIVYTQNGQRGYTGTTYGAMVRFEGNTAGTTFWDCGVLPQSVGSDAWAVSRDNATWMTYFDNSGNQFVRTSVRAPIFYDRDNTAYYVDPASTGAAANLNGSIRITGNAVTHPASTPTGLSYGIVSGYGDFFVQADTDGSTTEYVHISSGFAPKTANRGIRLAYNDFRWFNSGGTQRFVLDGNGNATFSGNVTAYSDIKLKDNIETIPDAVNKVKQVRGVTYTRKDLDDKEKRYSGVIAQEVEAVLPEVVGTNEKGTKHVAYGNMVGLLIEAIKEQQTQIEALTSEINTLKEMIK
jgi:hypothetical protein